MEKTSVFVNTAHLVKCVNVSEFNIWRETTIITYSENVLLFVHLRETSNKY